MSSPYPHLTAISSTSGKNEKAGFTGYPTAQSYHVPAPTAPPVADVHCQQCRLPCVISSTDTTSDYHVVHFTPCQHRYHMHCVPEAERFWNQCPKCSQTMTIGALSATPFEWQCACCREMTPRDAFMLAMPDCGHVVHLHCFQTMLPRYFDGDGVSCPQCHKRVATMMAGGGSNDNAEQRQHNGVLTLWKRQHAMLANAKPSTVSGNGTAADEEALSDSDTAVVTKMRRMFVKTTAAIQATIDTSMEASTATNRARQERQWVLDRMHEATPFPQLVVAYEQQFEPRLLDGDRCAVLNFHIEDFLFRESSDTRRYTFNACVEALSDLTWQSLVHKMAFKPYHLTFFTMDECKLLVQHDDFQVSVGKLRDIGFQFKDMVRARWSYEHFQLFGVTIGDLMLMGMTDTARAQQLVHLMPDEQQWRVMGWRDTMCRFFKIKRWQDLNGGGGSAGGAFQF
jgi:hypothetical protein